MQHHYDNIFYNSFKYLSFRKKKSCKSCDLQLFLHGKQRMRRCLLQNWAEILMWAR